MGRNGRAQWERGNASLSHFIGVIRYNRPGDRPDGSVGVGEDGGRMQPRICSQQSGDHGERTDEEGVRRRMPVERFGSSGGGAGGRAGAHSDAQDRLLIAASSAERRQTANIRR